MTMDRLLGILYDDGDGIHTALRLRYDCAMTMDRLLGILNMRQDYSHNALRRGYEHQ